MPTSQVRVRRVLVITADRRTDLVGRPLLYVPDNQHDTLKTNQIQTRDLVIARQIWNEKRIGGAL
jgi:hypothetical protein